MPRLDNTRHPLVRFVHRLLIAGAGIAFASHAQAKEGELIVQLRAEANIAPLLVKHQLSLMGRIGTRPIYRLKVLGKTKVNDKVAALGQEPTVLTAEPNHDYAATEPSSQNLGWAIGEPDAYVDQWALASIRLDEAHRHTRGKGIRVAVLDSGVDARHPALAGRLLPGFDFIDGDGDPSEKGDPAMSRTYGHGTHVAGLVARVAPEARIMPMRILDAGGESNAWVLAEAMLRAIDPDGDPATDDGAHVINLSVGTLSKTKLFKMVSRLVTCKFSRGKDSEDDDDDDTNGDDVGVSVADKARCQGFGGAVVVAAAGNRGDDKVREYPAAETSKGMLSVAASTSSGSLASFSNYGWVKLAAPGEGVTSTVPGGGYGTWSGTSMASPLVAGVAALVRAANRSMTVEEVVKRLQSSASKLCRTNLAQLDAAAAVSSGAARDKRTCK